MIPLSDFEGWDLSTPPSLAILPGVEDSDEAFLAANLALAYRIAADHLAPTLDYVWESMGRLWQRHSREGKIALAHEGYLPRRIAVRVWRREALDESGVIFGYNLRRDAAIIELAALHPDDPGRIDAWLTEPMLRLDGTAIDDADQRTRCPKLMTREDALARCVRLAMTYLASSRAVQRTIERIARETGAMPSRSEMVQIVHFDGFNELLGLLYQLGGLDHDDCLSRGLDAALDRPRWIAANLPLLDGDHFHALDPGDRRSVLRAEVAAFEVGPTA